MIGQIFLATNEQELQGMLNTIRTSGVPCQVITIEDVAQSPYGLTASIFLPPLTANICIIDNNDVNAFTNVYMSYLTQNVEVDQMLTIIAETIIGGTNVIFFAPSLSDMSNPIPWMPVFSQYISAYHGIFIVPFGAPNSSFNMNYLNNLVQKAMSYAIITDEVKALYQQYTQQYQQPVVNNLSSPFQRVERRNS